MNADELIYTAAIWPGSGKIASYDLQIEYGCDPAVVHLFESRFISHKKIESEAAVIWPAKKSEWIRISKCWLDADEVRRETSLGLH